MKQFTNTNRTMDAGVAQTPKKEKNKVKEYYGNWKYNLGKGILSLSPAARNLLGLEQGGNYELRQLFRLLDVNGFEKAKAWLRAAPYGGVLEPIQLKIYPVGSESIWVKLSGFHYAERYQSSEVIMGVIEDYTQHVNEERIALSIINHEMRTPLSVMKLNSQMIQLNPSVSHANMARNIERHVDGIIKLLDHYLSGAADHGKFQRLNLSIFDINSVARQVLHDIKTIYPDHRFIIKTSGEAIVNADRYLIMQVLINYLTNAVKFSPKNTNIVVDIRSDSQNILVSITDEGEGIAAGLEQRVFERFFSSGNTTTAPNSSRGLGLYLIKQIIVRHKGKVWVEKGADKGSVFFFTLPTHQ